MLAVTSEGSANLTVGRALNALVVTWIVLSKWTSGERNALIDAILDDQSLSAITCANASIIVEVEGIGASVT